MLAIYGMSLLGSCALSHNQVAVGVGTVACMTKRDVARRVPSLFATLAILGLSGAAVGCSPAVREAPPSSSNPTNTLSPDEQEARERWDSMDLEEQAASLLMLYYPGTDGAATAEFVDEFQPGGIIIMGDNVPEDETDIAANIQQWNEAAEYPLLIGIDEEGGTVTRLPSDTFPAAPQLRDGPAADTTEAFQDRAGLLESLGINVNFGIVGDTTDNPDSFIWPRVLGSTQELAAQNVAAAVQGEQGRAASTIKHFPGHGLTAEDSHTSIPTSDVTKEEWAELAKPPFQAGVDAGAEFVMMGHLAFPEIADGPASLSPEWYQILRDELGFGGVIITDSMTMLLDSGIPEYSDPVQNAVDAIGAGATMVLMVAAPGGVEENAEAMITGIAQAVRDGEIDQDAFNEAGILLMEQRIALEDGVEGGDE